MSDGQIARPLSAGGPAVRPGLAMIGALYIAQGLPLGFAFQALPVMLRDAGVALEAIAVLPFLGLPWVVKFLWAPVIDRYRIPRLGRRRGWILVLQTVLAVCMGAIAALPLEPASGQVIAFLVLLGVVAAATQDIATDGLVAETVRGERLASANMLQVGGMMAGYLAGGAGLLMVLDTVGHRVAMPAMAGLLLVALWPTARWRDAPEPVGLPHATPSVRAGFRNSFARPGIWRLLVVMFSAGTVYAGGMALTRLVLIDAGWSMAHVGAAAAVGGLALILVGGPLGSRLSARYGIWPALTAGLMVTAVAQVIWGLIAAGGLPTGSAVAGLAMILLGTGGGIAFVALYTLALRFAGAGDQAGTDATLLQSLSVLGEMVVSGAAVAAAAALGYAAAFSLTLLYLACVLTVLAWAARSGAIRPFATPMIDRDRGDDAAGHPKRTLGDIVTDSFARRPSGWLARRIYRRATAHQAGFQHALSAAPVGPDDRVLDVGCGGGAFLALVLERGAAAAGVDHSPDMLATTRDQNAQALVDGRLELHQADVAHLPFAADTFSHVFCLNAFFFFPDPQRVIAEMARVLKPGGRLAVLTVPPEAEAKIRRIFGPFGRRMRFDAPERLGAWVEAASLRIETVQTTDHGGYLHLSRKIAAKQGPARPPTP